jgi:predicted GNAT family N-acyltransferase
MEVKKVTTDNELQEAFRIRKEVFVEEQKVPEQLELDEHESEADHILVLQNGKPIGTGRVRLLGTTAKLERICVLREYRQHGVGRLIVQALESIAAGKGATNAKLSGQLYAERFYTSLGYEKASDVFLDAGIEHILMVKPRLAAT